MAEYFVSWDNGDDSNNGLGPDASDATNKPWKTLTKALGATSGVTDGDEIYICPGTQFETVTVAMTSATDNVYISGDFENFSGFKTGAGDLVPPGEVVISPYTSGYQSAASSTSTLVLAGRDYLRFESIKFIGGGNASAHIVNATTTTSQYIEFNNCVFVATGGVQASLILMTTTFGVPFHWEFNYCYFNSISSNAPIFDASMPGSASPPDYDCDVRVQNCVAIGVSGNIATLAGSSSQYKPGGWVFYSNTFMSYGNCFILNTGWSYTYPLKSFGNVLTGAYSAAQASTIMTNKNTINSGSTSSNVLYTRYNDRGSVNGNSTAYPLLLSISEERVFKRTPREVGEPTDISAALGSYNTEWGDCAYSQFTYDDSAVGTVSWTNPGNAEGSNDATFATASLALNAVSHYIACDTFAFGIPSDAEITGVLVSAVAKAGTTNRIQDQSVRLRVGGSVVGNDNATASTKLGTANNVVQQWGGATDLWGLSLSPSDVNDNGFGVSLSYKNTNASTTTCSFDAVFIQVYYTSPNLVQYVDARGLQRPSGGQSNKTAAGALEKSNIATRSIEQVHSGTYSLAIQGPGYHEFKFPVDENTTGISIWARYDSTYSSILLPFFSISGDYQVGIPFDSQNMVGPADTWEQLVSTGWTITGKGVATIQICSFDQNGDGKVFWDDFSIN